MRKELSENEILKKATRAVRKADRGFEESGGDSRHWVRDWFIPCLRQEGLTFIIASAEKDEKA